MYHHRHQDTLTKKNQLKLDQIYEKTNIYPLYEIVIY